MKKGNTLRIIFWSFITLLCLASGILGVIYNNQIFSVREDEMNSLIDTFNNKQIITNYENIGTTITASLDGKNIYILVDSTGTEDHEYYYTLKNGYLETELKTTDSLGRIILMAVADSISVYYGGQEGDLYPLFNDGTVLEMKFNEGIEYSKKNDTYVIKINLDTPIKKESIENEITSGTH